MSSGADSTSPSSPEAETFALNEDGIAIAFADRYSDILRHDHHRGDWYEWNRQRWKADHTDSALDKARRLCRSLNGNNGRLLAKAATIAAVERLARTDRRLAMAGDEWDPDPMLLGTPAGTVDLRTGEMRAADPRDLITRSTLVAPEPGEPMLWREVLFQATQGDEQLELFVRQIFGYALTADAREQCLFVLCGSGGNSKTTIIGALRNILGDYAVAASMDTFMAVRGERHSTDLAMLCGARLVVASETQAGRGWDEQRVKALTGGDPITARFMREDNFTFEMLAKVVLTSNSRPTLRKVDDAWRRRIHVLPFTYKPQQPDRTLQERLRAEYPRILQWAIDGCLDWQRHGLSVPACVRAETQGYFESQDVFRAWLEASCGFDKLRAELQADLYRSWKDYAEASGEYPGSTRAMGDMLEGAGFRRIRDTMGIRGRGYAGLHLKAAGAP